MKKLVQEQQPDGMIIGGKFSAACYITDSWPGVLYLALKYMEDPRKALLVNANLGGDNVHRGIVLGALLGLVKPSDTIPFYDELTENEAITREIEMFYKSSQSLGRD